VLSSPEKNITIGTTLKKLLRKNYVHAGVVPHQHGQNEKKELLNCIRYQKVSLN
jgi:hypothetical protein